MFLGGFVSEMSGRKACALEAHCRDNRRAFVAFDYRAHGLSSGRIDEFGFDAWIEDSLMVLDRLTRGPQILVGSSMGAWLLTLCLQRRPERIGAALGLAAAPDFIDKSLAAAADVKALASVAPGDEAIRRIQSALQSALATRVERMLAHDDLDGARKLVAKVAQLLPPGATRSYSPDGMAKRQELAHLVAAPQATQHWADQHR